MTSVVCYAQQPDTLANEPIDSAYIEELGLLLDVIDSTDIEMFETDSTFVPADSSLVNELGRLIERMEKAEKARKIIADYDNLMLRREQSFRLDGFKELLRGAILCKTEKNYRDNAPLFKDTGNDWLHYGVAGLPALATYVNKLCGVESVSTTKRMVLSNILAFGLSAGVTSGVKGLVDERRPDGSDSHSMPSGHTSFAFAAATILHREYGYISPWISVGGYATATATQFLRVHNNAHWINDIYIGAGIGIVSTNFAYFLADRILGKSGILHKPTVTASDINTVMRFAEGPSGLSLTSGIESGHVGSWTTEATFYAGLEYSYYFNKYLAAEALCRMSTTKVNEFQNNLLMYHTDAAFKCSVPVYPGYRFAVRAIGGGRFSDGIEEIKDNSLEIGGGCSIEYMRNDKYALGVNFDYYHAFSDLMKNRYSVSLVWKVVM